MDRIIPVFPLNVVIFPNSARLIHIFEPRYKRLIRHALDYKLPIGITTSYEDKVSSVGTLVEVHEWSEPKESGEFEVLIKAIQRFIIRKQWVHSIGYIEALVEEYGDHADVLDYYLNRELEQKFRSLLEKFDLHFEDSFWKNLHLANAKTYKIAEKCGLTLEQQVEILGIQQESVRAKFLIEHLNKLEEKLVKQAVTQLLMGDGYINN
jgi:Lon protease-like protein